MLLSPTAPTTIMSPAPSAFGAVHAAPQANQVSWHHLSREQFCRPARSHQPEWHSSRCSRPTPPYLWRTRLCPDLQEREREWRTIADTVPGLVATLTPAGEVEVVNERVLTYCGRCWNS